MQVKPIKAKPSSLQRPEHPDAAMLGDDGLEPETKGAPLRQCIVTRERYPKEVMIRFVAAPDGTLAPDLQARLPGRGCWVIADRAAIQKATDKHLFARALGEAVTVDPGLSDRIEALLARRCLELLGQALGAGALTLGSGAIHAAARQGQLVAVIEAADGAPDGRRKILASLKAGGLLGHRINEGKAVVIGCFTSSELSLALGRQNVIHAAMPEGGLAGRLMMEARRLEGFRPLIPEAWTRRPGPAQAGAASDA